MMAEGEARDLLWYKRKAITSLFPYAVLQERDGQPEMLDTFLHAVRASRKGWFMQYCAKKITSTLLSKASPRAIILASSHIPWHFSTDKGDLVQRWTAAASGVPYTEESAQNVVDTLLQIASDDKLSPHITVDIWSWLTKRPSLPPICRGRSIGTHPRVIKAVRALKDIEILKSYFLLVWSEWDFIQFRGTNEICASICKDFGGIGMGHHRADLIQRLDYVLGQLDRGLEHLTQHNPDLNRGVMWAMESDYGRIKKILLETNIEAITRASNPMITLLCVLTRVDVRRISRNIYVCTSSPVSVALRMEPSASPLPRSISTWNSIPAFIRHTSYHTFFPLLTTLTKRTLFILLFRWAIVMVFVVFSVSEYHWRPTQTLAIHSFTPPFHSL
jgi:hypothetical protein